MFGFICSVFPSARYNLFKLDMDGLITRSKKIIPKPPNHCSVLLHIAMEYGSRELSYNVNPVDVIPDMLSKYASMKDKSPDIIKGNAEKSVVINHISITKNSDAFRDSFIFLSYSVL